MHRGFGGAAFEPEDEGRDREVTLGPAMLVGLAVGLCALCGVFFIWGYSVGHGSPAAPLSDPAASGASAAQLLGGQSKPAASQNSFEPHKDASLAAAADGSAAGTSPEAAPVTASYPASGSATASSASPSVVQTALPAQPMGAQTVSGGQVQPAMPQGSAWMVQIAAVSHPEDAEVLVGALRKRGYAVSIRHDPLDNLMHVQVGPFATHTDAAQMRQRLLGDGYNAIIEP
ncbi:MAG TPA: SPOR domain-containing protein [Terracidiphilus sp.]|jgi:cell division septation protein DedD|nr:SPOR domain-containing protein [Terracidiphilus sp.]